MGDGFDWCLYHDSVYEPFLGYGREVTIHVYQPGTYLLEVTHTDGGASVTIEITVEGSLEMDE